MDIVTVFIVTDLTTGQSYREFIKGDGQEAASAVMRLYPRFSKFVLEGHEVDGTFFPLYLR